MLKILKKLWNTNSKGLYNEIKKLTANQIEDLMYLDLVKMTFKHIYPEIDTEKITEIDNGNYQGTLLYVMPFNTFQPGANEYLLTNVSYGSCSFCDTLQGVKFCTERETQNKNLFTLCRHMVVETVKPYNYGWRRDEEFDIVDDLQ